MPDGRSDFGPQPGDGDVSPLDAPGPGSADRSAEPTRDLDSVRALLAFAADAVVLIAHSGRIEWASDALHRVLGYEPEDVVGTEFFTYVHAEDVREAAEAFRLIVDGDPAAEASVVRAKHAAGGYRWIEATASTVVDDPHLGSGVVLSLRDVSKRKETEDKLRSSEEWFKALVQHTSEGFVTIGAGTTVTYASPSVERILGRSADDLIGTNGLELLVEEDRDRVAGGLVNILAKPGHTVREQVRIEHPTEGIRWIDAGAVNLLENPDIEGIVVTFRDITDGRMADDSLRASEERFKALVQNGSDVVLILDEEANVSYASPSLERVFGFSPDEVLGTPGMDFMHPDDLEIAVENMAGVIATPEVPRTAESRLRHADGSWRWVEAHLLNLLEDPHVRGIVATMRDITDRRRTEGALRDSDARFRAVVDNSRDVTGILNADGLIAWGTPKVEAMLGYTVDELVGTSAFDLVHPDDLEEATTEFARTLDGDYEMHPLPVRARHKNGDWVDVEVLASDIRSDPGVPEGIVLNIRDASWRVEAEEVERRSEARFRALVQYSSDGVVVIGADGTVNYASPSIDRIFSRSAEQLMEENGLDLVHPDDREMVSTELAMLIDRPGESLTRELRSVDPEGRTRWIEATVVNMLDNPDVVGIVANVRDISERKAMEGRLEHAATHDPLTGLPNRTLLHDRLQQAFARAKRSKRSVGVLFLDLDNFKLLNDTHGHGFGDKALVAVSDRIAAALRVGDTVSRFGGDEFIVLCEDIRSLDEAQEIAERLHYQVTGPMVVEGVEMFVETSIGVAVTGDPETDPDDLIRDADAAMYRAKDRGRGRVEMFDSGVRELAVERLDLESALHRALERDEITISYEPVLDLRTNHVAGLEATPQWHHPDRGLLAADEFMEAADETGVSIPIGVWLLEDACRVVWKWTNDLRPDEPIRLGVNLSSRQLDDPELIDEVERVTTVTGIDADQLHLEIPEGVMIADVDRTAKTLEALSRQGVHISVDDFGTGYSSLSYLRRFPVDQLKLDAAFVDETSGNEGNAAIIGAIIRLAHTLGMKVTAEHIESGPQLEELRRLGCDYGQGPLLAGARDAAGIAQLLAK